MFYELVFSNRLFVLVVKLVVTVRLHFVYLVVENVMILHVLLVVCCIFRKKMIDEKR